MMALGLRLSERVSDDFVTGADDSRIAVDERIVELADPRRNGKIRVVAPA
jgi:hypothetical protein